MTAPSRTAAGRPDIAALNDRFRRALPFGRGGRAVMTRAVATLPEAQLGAVLAAVRTFDRFTPDNDPWGEHDCGRLQVDGEWVIFKFDYYADAELDAGAEDGGPSCYRVLTIMLGSDY